MAWFGVGIALLARAGIPTTRFLEFQRQSGCRKVERRRVELPPLECCRLVRPAPRAVVIQVRGRRHPARAVLAGHYAAWLVVRYRCLDELSRPWTSDARSRRRLRSPSCGGCWVQPWAWSPPWLQPVLLLFGPRSACGLTRLTTAPTGDGAQTRSPLAAGPGGTGPVPCGAPVPVVPTMGCNLGRFFRPGVDRPVVLLGLATGLMLLTEAARKTNQDSLCLVVTV